MSTISSISSALSPVLPHEKSTFSSSEKGKQLNKENAVIANIATKRLSTPSEIDQLAPPPKKRRVEKRSGASSKKIGQMPEKSFKDKIEASILEINLSGREEKEKKLRKAEGLCRGHLDENPEDAFATGMLADTLRLQTHFLEGETEKKKLWKAEGLCRRCLNKNPENALAIGVLARILKMQADSLEGKAKEEKLQEAKDLCVRYLVKDHENTSMQEVLVGILSM